ncbi:cytochrome c oxidase cbb3-type subunit 4 [Rhizobium sp. SG_E_25_P2]|jgi:cytochrome c oxidase cbb3-type subunit IV|uniref:cbb3-type cytochrome c oxidase subunit 3 n=1 Tax=Rhizobium sp. SG_E_25_P2 TaxID=2879942 RepID=UPI002474AF96|nr:cbb3-type cytochrome c oxidase subunit 3 [Rhizobium sp. SG_E_25_P2]MDH6267267.1 cytochrome c oxidase cbb3-type subunit 4 [Rhizobium sp. SG_E_25_P2]
METYEAMRAFADSWGMLAMLAFFIVAIAFTLRPGAKKHADAAAQIPLKED